MKKVGELIQAICEERLDDAEGVVRETAGDLPGMLMSVKDSGGSNA